MKSDDNMTLESVHNSLIKSRLQKMFLCYMEVISTKSSIVLFVCSKRR